MPTHQPYPNAPLTEALIDFRVKFNHDISLDKLKRFGAEVSAQYPNETTRDLLQGQINFGASEPQTQSSRTAIGYIYHSGDRRQAVQARLDGFTFSRFTPYQDWAHLVKETKRLWGIFIEVLRPTVVVRVAVRYVNQINLPLKAGTLRFEDYLRTFPQLTGIEEDVDLEQFFVRLVMPQRDLSARLILTETLLPPQDHFLGVILDIDLFRDDISLDARSEEIWAILEMFRSRKNKYFEASITDAARELFA